MASSELRSDTLEDPSYFRPTQACEYLSYQPKLNLSKILSSCLIYFMILSEIRLLRENKSRISIIALHNNITRSSKLCDVLRCIHGLNFRGRLIFVENCVRQKY